MYSKPTDTPDGTGFSARDMRRRDKIRQIVGAAAGLFLEEGFAATSMDRIVEKAGVSKRTLYNCFSSKDEVFIAVMQMQLGTIFDNFSPERLRSADLTEQLRRVSFELLRLANAPETLSLFRVIAAESQRFPRLAQQFFEQSFENVIDGIASTLDHHSDNPDLRIPDTRQAGEYFLDLLTGTAYLRVVFGTTPPMNEQTIRARTERALGFFFETY